MRQINRHPQTTKQLVCLFFHATFVNDAHRINRITTKKKIVNNIALKALIKLLVDHGDTVFQGILWSGEAYFPTIEKDLTLVFLIRAKQALHHGGLAGTVLSHKTHNAALTHVKIDMVKYAVSPKGLAHPFD